VSGWGVGVLTDLYKSMTYILAVHVPIAGVALVPVLLGWPVLLLPMHVACLELVIDPACSLVFETEPAEPDLMAAATAYALALAGGRCCWRCCRAWVCCWWCCSVTAQAMGTCPNLRHGLLASRPWWWATWG
jgi:magnesium-transporting ATPase (P-type)